jgi:hypothetical protein
LEALVESLVDDKSYDKSEKHAAEALRSLGGTEFPLTPHSEDTPSANGLDNGQAPLLSLFDNAVLSRAESQKSVSTSGPSPANYTTPSINIKATYTPLDCVDNVPAAPMNPAGPINAKDQRARHALMAVLPPHAKLLTILNSQSHMWAVFQRKCPGTRESASIEEFANRVLNKGSPCEMGMLVLLMGSCTEGDLLDQCLALVDRWIISDDDYMGTLQGLECAILQGKIYADIGQARRSWLAFRRGLTLAQLMGLHRNHSLSLSRESIWWSLYGADRLTSLMLGMPYGIPDAHCNMDFMGQAVHKSVHPLAFFAKIAYFAGKVVDRSQGLQEATYASALDLEEELNQYASQMPPGWWDVGPMVACEDPNIAYEWQEKVLGQMAFHQIKAYLHMPFMLKSASNQGYDIMLKSRSNSGYDSSRRACIDGSREMLRLYHMLRAEGTPLYECKAVDFVGFTACILLVLGLMGYGRENMHNPLQDESDWGLIEQSMDIFKRASSEKGGKVAAQSYQALAQLHQVKNFDCSGPETDPNQVTKIVIPFFGTISVKRGHSFKHVATPGSSTQNTPCSNPLTTPTTPNISDISQQAAASYSSMDPQIMYDGFYMPPSMPQSTAFDPHIADDNLSSYLPVSNTATGAAGFWPSNMGVMDLDLDQDWFMNNDMSLHPTQMQYNGFSK